ncbi:hypothetical protein ACI5FR_09650 [Paenibacillus sp. HJGM_3]
MNRQGRLQSAVSWLREYKGKNYIHGYRKHYGVDTGTAIAELRMLGVPLSDEAVRTARASAAASVRAKQARKEKRRLRLQEEQLAGIESDETLLTSSGIQAGDFHTALHGKRWNGSPTRIVLTIQSLPESSNSKIPRRMRRTGLIWNCGMRKKFPSIWKSSSDILPLQA